MSVESIYNYSYFVGAFALIAIGLYTIMVKRNLIKILIGINILDVGINLFLVSLGYIKGKGAPIFFTGKVDPSKVIDPIPQALVLTAIVIGLAVTALSLSVIIKLYKHYKTLDISEIREMKW